MATNIETGMIVIRNEAALKPIVGIVKEVFSTMYGYPRKVVATVEWQDSTRRMNGGTTTTSTIQVSKLLMASDENIESMKTKAHKVTPYMKSAMGLWREFIGNEDFVRWDDIRERLGCTWQQWGNGYEKACEKLITLGYLEPHEENRNYNTGNRKYRITARHD